MPIPIDEPCPRLVWFKRDLRLADHAPLVAAAQGPALALFIVEPVWLASAEFDAQHLAFTLACLAPLRDALAERGLPLRVQVGEATEVLARLHAQRPFAELLSHEETGPWWSWQRDRAVARWCSAAGVAWREWPHTGVVRRLRTRQGWAGRWAQRMDAPLLATPTAFQGALTAAQPVPPLPTLAELGVQGPVRPLPEAGEAAAHATLHSFLHERGAAYRKNLSSPLSAEQGCSRLSAHLAFGTLSMRQVHQATEAAIQQHAAAGNRAFAYALRGFAGRLRWHCHFMQKLESEPELEWRHFARLFDGVRASDGTPGAAPWGAEEERRFAAWCEGRTGYPMVDACMRSLLATGWLNFRMRAMLVSFAAYHLWLHWREPGLFLARQFLDFEPGIHWSQMQMQSGTTGINTLRMYSPAKQQRDHDPDFHFIRRWLPEWGTAAYPEPIVDERSALASAKATLYGLRKTGTAKLEADAVQARHGSRRSGLPPSPKPRTPARKAPKPSPQQDLF